MYLIKKFSGHIGKLSEIVEWEKDFRTKHFYTGIFISLITKTLQPCLTCCRPSRVLFYSVTCRVVSYWVNPSSYRRDSQTEGTVTKSDRSSSFLGKVELCSYVTGRLYTLFVKGVLVPPEHGLQSLRPLWLSNRPFLTHSTLRETTLRSP